MNRFTENVLSTVTNDAVSVRKTLAIVLRFVYVSTWRF